MTLNSKSQSVSLTPFKTSSWDDAFLYAQQLHAFDRAIRDYTEAITSNKNSEVFDWNNYNKAVKLGESLGLSEDQVMKDYQTQSPAIESVHPEALLMGAGAIKTAGQGLLKGTIATGKGLKAIGNWIESKLPGIGKATTLATGVDGARHFLSPEGGAKTFNKMYLGDWVGAGLSAVGDLLDLTGMKQASTMYNLAKNSGLSFGKALELLGTGTNKMVQNIQDLAKPTIQNLNLDLQQAKAAEERALNALQQVLEANLNAAQIQRQMLDKLAGHTWTDVVDPWNGGPHPFRADSFVKLGSKELEKHAHFERVLEAMRLPDPELPRSLRVSTRVGDNHTYTPEQLLVFYSRHPEIEILEAPSTSTLLTHYRTGDVHQIPTVTSDPTVHRIGSDNGAAIKVSHGLSEDKLTPEDLAVIDDNIKYIQELIPGFLPIGSSLLARAGALPKNPHDIDGEISAKAFHNLETHYADSPRLMPRDPERGMWSFTPVDKDGVPRPEWDVDVNVVDPSEHNKDLAKEIYKQFYPDAYVAQHSSRLGTGKDFKFLDINGTPITSEQLILKVQENPTVKSIMDAFEIVPEGVKAKHALKPLQILASPATEDTAKALENLSLRYYGIPRVLPKLSEQLPSEEVSKILQELQVPRNIANSIALDPKKVQNFMDWYALSEASLMRGITPPEAPATNLQAMTLWRPGGGSAAGAGLNMTHGGSSNFGKGPGDITGHVFLDPTAWNTTNIKTALDSFRKLLPKGLLWAGINPDVAKAKFYEEMANKFPGARGFSGDTFGSGVYAGMLDLKPEKDIIRMSPDNEALVGLTRRIQPSINTTTHFVNYEHPWQQLNTKRILDRYISKNADLESSPVLQLPKEVIFGTSQNPGILPLLKKYESYAKQAEGLPFAQEWRDLKAFAADQLREALLKYNLNLNNNIDRVLLNKDLRKLLDYKPNPYYQPAFWATRPSQQDSNE